MAEFQDDTGAWIAGTATGVSDFDPTQCSHSNNCNDEGWILGHGSTSSGSAQWTVVHARPIVAVRVYNVYGGGSRGARWEWSGTGSYGNLGTWAYSADACGWHDYTFPGSAGLLGTTTFTARVNSITNGHSPRSCAAEFQDDSGTWIAGTPTGISGTFNPSMCSSNNCVDSGWILRGSDTAQWGVQHSRPIVAVRVYNVYGGGSRGARWDWSGTGSYGNLGTWGYSASSCGWHDYTFA